MLCFQTGEKGSACMQKRCEALLITDMSATLIWQMLLSSTLHVERHYQALPDCPE